MINYEIKSQLAKLLATEDLVVENRNVETASFDVETRVLTLPMWELASGSVYDMLVGHEVGHALYTPDKWDFLGKIPKAFVNVTEDARIEKLMKRRYPGLAKTFYRGYSELSETDFFGIEDLDISEMSLPDRVNLYYKIGSFVTVPFTDEEQKIVDLVGKSESFDEAVHAAEVMYKYVGESLTNQEPVQDQEQTESKQGESEQTEKQQEPTSEKEQSNGDGELTPEDIEPETESKAETSDPFDVSTDEAFSDGAQALTNNPSRGAEYYEVPQLKTSDYMASNKEIHDLCVGWFSQYQANEFVNSDTEYNRFKKSAQKEVNYLVKEFECKKAADSYARSSTSRTGVLDCSKLHTYKFNEDLFKKVNVIPDGKNHGLIFILDWSGSMCDQMEDTIKQLYNLIWFCSKVNIPFDVYAFTSSYRRRGDYDSRWINTPERGKLVIDRDFSLMNLLTSGVNKKTLDIQMKNLFRIVWEFRHYVSYSSPCGLGLSSTPLNESLVALHTILPEFKKQHQLQKVQVVILTDGEAHQLNAWNYYSDYFDGERKLFPQQISGRGFLRNRKTGHTYEVGYRYYDFTDVLLKDLKQTFPDTNFIGFRLVPPRDFSSICRRYSYVSDTDLKKYRKDKSYNMKESGYHSLFVILQNSLNSDASFDVDEGESKAKIKSAFMKSLKAKTLNKKVLSQFMDLVC